MQDYQREFIAFALGTGALQLGSVTLKSGRVSPYFFNAGRFHHGGSLARLGRFYAHAIVDAGVEFDLLYGPAYKGIPLAVATAIALAEEHGRDLPWAFNRKEEKDHGEGGRIVGGSLRGDVLIVDDVITAGTSVRESVDLIRAAGARPAGVVIALDRCERGVTERSAIDEIRDTLGLAVASIVTLDHLIAYLEPDPESRASLAAMREYRARYGV